ncbi:MAG: hypothetical protein B0W54_20645 [Cellvibrio sp. 79]|nr:MAG: hypothetical protein B0W54_20645 [Cellvibrio sp. 79]
MALQVTLIKTPGSISLPRNNHIFDQRGGTFGRADSNTWVLPDPDKFLSSCHCEVVYADTQFYLEDKSTNGTFVNGSFEPLGRGIRYLLRDGDFFEIGEYRFSIQLEQQPQGAFASPFDAAPSFSGNSSLFDDLPKTDFFGDAPGDASLFDQQQDPLALWDKRPPVQQPQRTPFDTAPEYSANNKGTNTLLDDFVGLGKPTSDTGFQAMDMASSMDQAISWPTAKSESLIPEDWADDLMGHSPIANPINASPRVTRNEVIPDDDLLSPFATNTPAVTDTPFDIPKPAARVPLAERIFAMEQPAQEKLQPFLQESLQPVPVSVPFPEKTVAPPVVVPVVEIKPPPHVPTPPPVTQVAPVDHAANRVLVEALGLDVSRLSDADMVEINRVAGLLMREIVDGMLGVLRSRASIKNEFRMNVTTIQPVENNPLKFSVCVDDALENLFIKKSNAYKKPVEAFREGFQEIAEHQLAMIAGIRQGFEAMMERFNPEHLEKSFSKQVKGSVIPGMQKAKFWNSYSEYYQGFTDNMESSFQHLFGSDFVSAYEDQLRRLTAARKRGESSNNE